MGQLDELLRLSRFAFHAEHSRHHRDAADAYMEIATRASRRHDYLGAEILYSRALGQMAELVEDALAGPPAVPPAREMAARRGRALMRYRLGRYQDSLEDFSRARALATAQHDHMAEIEILLDEATALDWCDEWQESAARVGEARALAGKDCSPLLQAHLLMAEGRSLCRQNRDAESVERLVASAHLAKELGDAAYETHVIALALSGYLLSTLGRFEESQRQFEYMIPLCEERGDLMHLAVALGNRSMLWMAKNDYAKVLIDLRGLLDIARELGNARLEQHAHYYLGQYLLWMGEIEDAERHARRAQAIDASRFADSARQESSLLVARVLVARGQQQAARTELDRIRARQESALSQGHKGVELNPLEEAHFSMVDLATRAEFDDGAWDLLEARARNAVPDRDMLEMLEVRAHAALEGGKVDTATTTLQRAMTMAARIPDLLGEQRARIERALQTVAENAR